MFKAGSNIRNLETGEIYLVIQSFKYAILVGKLDSNEVLNDGKYIYQRDFDKFAPDVKCERQKFGEVDYKWRQYSI